MFIKSLLSVFALSSFLNASCVSTIDINFNFEKERISIISKVQDSKKSIQMNYSGFKIEDINKLDETLQNGGNLVEFSYNKEIKGLNENYISLLSDWYPLIENGCQYTITTSLDNSYKSVYEDTKNEIDNISFIASKHFIVNNKKYNNINIETYFLKDDKELSSTYLNKSIEYIELYEKSIGKFPYNKFRVVENVYSTGYSMPTFTLIGSRLLKKPYVLNQSLGHEILHQYFGNSIFNDFKEGNWVEGLTTFLADDYYKKLLNNDINHRKTILNEYNNFVTKDNEFPINEFNHRFDKSSQLIGYSKLSFVFHMLKNKIGSKDFDTLIKKLYEENKFKEVSLKELVSFFDKNTNIDLKTFFNQWLYKRGRIDFKIKKEANYYDKNGFSLSFSVIQDENNFYEFDLPITITTYDKEINKNIKITKANQHIKLNFSSEILKISMDNKIDLFRKLFKNEELLSISFLMNQKDLIAVVNKKDMDKYKNIKTIFPNAKIVYSDDLKFNDLKQNTVLFLDYENKQLNHFYPNINIDKENSFLIVKEHIYDKNRQMAVINFGKYKSGYFMMLKHYSKYKEIIFTKDKIIKKMDSSDFGFNFEFNTIPTTIKIAKNQSIKNIFDEIKDKRIVYVGEAHNNFAHHLSQLRVIKALRENGKKVSIAMEMFQTPFQKDLDEYISGITSLEDFLKNTEYFKRWKFDYNLYKPIIDYAKLYKLPVIAINLDRNITSQVSKKGLLSLNEQQKVSLPKYIDQSNLIYKESLGGIFKGHNQKDGKKDIHSLPTEKKDKHPSSKINLDYFYQSQLIWDEVMAENINNYIKVNDDRVLVVIVGSGHVIEHYGIPSRVYNRNSLPYKVILNDYATSKVGDVVVVNKKNNTIKKQNKLGVYLKNNEELIVMDIVKDSFSSKIGIKKDDLIVELNSKKVDNLYDLKRVLYFVEDLNKAVLKVKRGNKIVKLSQTL